MGGGYNAFMFEKQVNKAFQLYRFLYPPHNKNKIKSILTIPPTQKMFDGGGVYKKYIDHPSPPPNFFYIVIVIVIAHLYSALGKH